MPFDPKPIPHPLRDWKYLRPPSKKYDYFAASPHLPFCPQLEGCPPGNATYLADIALLSYAPLSFAEPRFLAAGFGRVRLLGGHGTHAYVAENDTSVVAAFRGTQIDDPREFLRDLKIDLRFTPVESPHVPGKIHGGFERALDEVWPEFALAMREARKAGKTVWLTGHSLGGALATIAAVRLGDVTGVCTFAAPRPGDAAFATAAQKLNLTRFVHQGDVIPRMPPRRLGFVQTGDRHVISKKGQITREPEPNRLYEAKSLELLLKNWLTAARLNLFDHSPVLYATHVYNASIRAGDVEDK